MPILWTFLFFSVQTIIYPFHCPFYEHPRCPQFRPLFIPFIAHFMNIHVVPSSDHYLFLLLPILWTICPQFRPLSVSFIAHFMNMLSPVQTIICFFYCPFYEHPCCPQFRPLSVSFIAHFMNIHAVPSSDHYLFLLLPILWTSMLSPVQTIICFFYCPFYEHPCCPQFRPLSVSFIAHFMNIHAVPSSDHYLFLLLPILWISMLSPV